MDSKMKFLCEDSCVNTKDGESWRGSKEYDLTEGEVRHLKVIGHLKRFKPLSNSAIDFMIKLKEEDPKPVEPPITDMSFSEIKALAAKKEISLPDDVTRLEAINIMADKEPADKEPAKDEALEDLTVADLKQLAKDYGLTIPKDTVKADIIRLLKE